MKVKRLKNMGFEYWEKQGFVVDHFSKLFFTKREALSFVRFVLKYASLTSKERHDLHQCIMNEQYTQRKSK